MNDRVIEIIEILFAVEILEYHNKNWLSAGDVVRSQKKQGLLREAYELLQTAERQVVVDENKGIAS